MARAARLAAKGAVLLFALLVLYESFALWRADRRTPEVLRRAAQGELELADLSERRIAMLLKIEDPGFTTHHGVDFSTPGAGMTSITQSLVKRFYFEDFQPGFAKLEQSLIAWLVLDPAMAKDAQLKAYLNHSHFGWREGSPVLGLAAAAWTYYGREVAELSDRQYLSLIAMLMSPREYHPVYQRAANGERVRRIEAMLAGRCAPQGLRDVTYMACAKLANERLPD